MRETQVQLGDVGSRPQGPPQRNVSELKKRRVKNDEKTHQVPSGIVTPRMRV